MNEDFVFCVFCETSYENEVGVFLQNLGYNVISALVERNIYRNGKFIKEYRSIIPGYVFFENNCEPDWNEIYKFKYIYYPLKYTNNQKRLNDNDLQFVKWLKGYNGKIKISNAIKIGNKLKFIDGPLTELESFMVKLNKKHKCAGIKIEGENIKRIIWLSYELVE